MVLFSTVGRTLCAAKQFVACTNVETYRSGNQAWVRAYPSKTKLPIGSFRQFTQLTPDKSLLTLRWKAQQLADDHAKDDISSRKCFNEILDGNHVVVFRDVISETEHDAIVEEIDSSGTDPSIKRYRDRPYETAHWDQVITGYKELERPLELWNCENSKTIKNIQVLIDEICTSMLNVNLQKLPDGETVAWLPPHIIDLSQDGEIFPHVDSIKHSDQIVAGISLLSTRVMKLRQDKEDLGDYADDEDSLDIELPPRSLYILSKDARFKMAHSIAKEENAQRRLSLIFRDDLPPPWI